jgi:hypothetical protein
MSESTLFDALRIETSDRFEPVECISSRGAEDGKGELPFIFPLACLQS